MANEDELKQVYSQFTAAWKFYRKYADVQDTDQYWENMIDEADQLAEQHGNGRLIRGLIAVVADEFERKYKEKFKESEGKQ